MGGKWKKIVKIIGLGLLIGIIPSVGLGEYYQYKDSEGVVRFTDDTSIIPPDQRDAVQMHKSISTPPGADFEAETENSTEAVEGAPQSAMTSDDRAESEALNARRKELLEMYREIQAEKKALGGAPPKSAKSAVKADYEQMARALNQKVEDYNKASMEFEQKVKAFNSRISAK